MSSPSETAPEESVSVSSPLAVADVWVDSASSTQGTGPPPTVTVLHVQMGASPSAPRQIVPAAPNTSFDTRMSDVRARSASPRPRRTISPPSLSVAQQRARYAEQRVEDAFSGIGVVADQTRRAQAVAEEAIAEAQSVRTEVSLKIAEAAIRANVSASSVQENLVGQIRDVAAQSEAHTSRTVGELQNRTREFVEGHRRDLEAKISQNQAEARQTAQDAKKAYDDLSARLGDVATQLTQMNAV